MVKLESSSTIELKRRYTDENGGVVDHERDRLGFALRLVNSPPGTELDARDDILVINRLR